MFRLGETMNIAVFRLEYQNLRCVEVGIINFYAVLNLEELINIAVFNLECQYLRCVKVGILKFTLCWSWKNTKNKKLQMIEKQGFENLRCVEVGIYLIKP